MDLQFEESYRENRHILLAKPDFLLQCCVLFLLLYLPPSVIHNPLPFSHVPSFMQSWWIIC